SSCEVAVSDGAAGAAGDPLAVAVEVALQAGTILRGGFAQGAPSPLLGRPVRADTKRAPTDLVTEYDRRNEAHIVAALRAAFPAYWEMKLSPWDLAAGALLVEEAGGRVTGWRGEPFLADRGAAIATNGPLHPALLAALAEIGIPAAATR